jgi:desert hedgehog protein
MNLFYPFFISIGTLLVNDIMASCYANVQSHEAAQFYMGPLRLYHWLAQSLFINKPFGYQEMDGMHFIPRIMYEFCRFFRPSTLRLT